MPRPFKTRTLFWSGSLRTCGKWSRKSNFPPGQLVADLKAGGKEALYFPDTDQLLTGLLQHLRAGDVVLIMSNGDFNQLVRRLCAALEKPSLKT